MSEASTNVERAASATVEAVANAVAAPSETAAAVTRAAEKSAPAAKPVKAEAKKAAPAAATADKPKRKYKPRAKAAAAPQPAKVSKKAEPAPARRKYTRKPAVAAVAAAAPQIKGFQTMTNEMPNWFAGFTTVPGADKYQTLLADAGEKGQDAVRKSQAFAGQLTDAARANIEAVVESSRIAAAGARDLGQEVVASTRSGVEQASTAVKTLAEAKSPTEFFQLQSELVRSSFDRMVAEGSKFTEQLVKLTGEAIQPLSNRASVSAEKFSELTA